MKVLRVQSMLGMALACSCFHLIIAQQDVDTALSEVFGNEEGKSPEGQKPQECECVSFYLCRNDTDTISEYGEDVIDIRFGETTCPHYMDVCCSLPPDQKPVDPNSHPTPPPVPTKDNLQPGAPPAAACGNWNSGGLGFKITGDSNSEANYGEFPWMVPVLRRDVVSGDINIKVMECGGSIIHPQVILTAAHCVRGKKNLFVRAGEWDTQTEKEIYPTEDKNVSDVIIHENYYAGGLHNDVALLVLESPLEMSALVSPICLPEQDEDMDRRRCVVTGWGKDVFGKEGQYQAILKKIEQPIIPSEECQERLRQTKVGKRFKLHESLMCAGGEIGKDACKGDGGGPLACPSKDNPNVYVQAGIVAWGIGCGTENPAVYGKVPHFRNWIDNKMAALNFS